MTDESLQRAKEIFFQYTCNHFFLDREVEAEEYRKIGVSRAQEYAWTQEYTSYWISQLSVDDFQAVNKLSSAHAVEGLREMIRMSTRGDSLAKLWYANAMWNIASGSIMFPILRARAKQKAVFLWKSLLKNPVELTEEHRKMVSKIVENQARLEKSIQVATPDDYVLNYARNKLAEAKERRFLFLTFVIGIGKILFTELANKIKRFGERLIQKS